MTRLDTFWQRFLNHSGRAPETRWLEAFHFCDNEADARWLAELVLSGKKRATASLQWTFDATGGTQPKPGDLSIVTAFDGTPLAVIETRDVAVHPFIDVPFSFAQAENEGDTSIEGWREQHRGFFERECERIEREPSAHMPIVCEYFEVLFRA
ncbi:ASCH domain-containing protein [Chitinibacteraceae bacterium HSL-7]